MERVRHRDKGFCRRLGCCVLREWLVWDSSVWMQWGSQMMRWAQASAESWEETWAVRRKTEVTIVP